MANRVTSSSPNQPASHSFQAYSDFIDSRENLKNPNNIVVGLSENQVITLAPNSWLGNLIQWCIGKSLVNDFRTALREQYGQEIAQYATEGLSSRLTTGMIKDALLKAQQAQEVRAARDEIEVYTRLAESKAAAIKILYPEEKNAAVTQAKQAVEQARAALDLVDHATSPEQLKEAVSHAKKAAEEATKAAADLQAAVQPDRKEIIRKGADAEYQHEASVARGIADQAKAEADNARVQLERISEELTANNNRIDESIQKKETEAIISSGCFDANNAEQMAKIEIADIRLNAAQEKTDACLKARSNSARYQSIIARAQLAEAAAEVRKIVVEIRTKEASADQCNAAVADFDRERIIAESIITHAEEAETAAMALKTSNPPLALRIFEAASMAKTIALNRQTQQAMTNDKRVLAEITDSLSSLDTDPISNTDVEQACATLKQAYLEFLLAEATSLEASHHMAKKIALGLNELAEGNKEKAHQTEREIDHASDSALVRNRVATYRKTATLLEKAASSYDSLATAKSAEIIKAGFAREAIAFEDMRTSFKGDANQNIAWTPAVVFSAIQNSITPTPLATIGDILAIDEKYAKTTQLMGRHGRIITSVPDNSLVAFTQEQRASYLEGINLVRLALAKKFGMNEVKQFDDFFATKIEQKSPLTIGELQNFLSQKNLTHTNSYFISQTTSLSELYAQLANATDNQIIKSDSSISSFNPFTTQRLVNQPETEEKETELGIAATLQIIVEITKQINNEINNEEIKKIKKKFNQDCNTPEIQRYGLKVSTLKKFLQNEFDGNYLNKLFKKYVTTSTVIQSAVSASLYHIWAPLGTLALAHPLIASSVAIFGMPSAASYAYQAITRDEQ